MVVVSELSGIFWGVALEGGNKRYTQTTERPVHISMAAIDPTQQHDDNPVSVMIEQEGNSYVLCNLKYGSLFQQPLDLEFATGETITFYVRGKGIVHLSGYIMPEDEFPEYEADDDDDDSDSQAEEASESDDDDDDEEDDKTAGKPGKKRPKTDSSAAGNKSKKPKLTIDDIDSDEDSDDDDFIEDEAEEGSDDSDDDDDSDEAEELVDEMEDLEEDSEDESEDEANKSKSKKAKKDKKKGKNLNGSKLNEPKDSEKQKPKDKVAVVDKTPAAKETKSVLPTSTPKQKQEQPSKPAAQAQPASQQVGVGDASTEGKKKKKKNKKKNQQGEASPAATSQQQPAASPSKSSGKRMAQGGVVVEDLKEGHGPEAKIGKTVRVYYTGRLQNGKIFDSSMTGNGFKFKLGKKEVISGWDVGLDGMKVGGKRKLIIPPKMGYGSQSAGGIPPNSTLIFDVELKAVN